MQCKKIYSVVITIVAFFSLIGFFVLFFHGGYNDKILIRLGLKEREMQQDWAVFSWDSCLEQLDYDADIVFFGDSITRGGNFQNHFPNKKIVNLGYSGDSLQGMIQRISMVKNLNPEKVFILGGINGLNEKSLEKSVIAYDSLLKELKEALPETEFYIQSVLPISRNKEDEVCENGIIKKFNAEIKKLAHKYSFTYIDLHSSYFENGELNPRLSKEDGIHINNEAYDVWADIIKEYVDSD